MTPASRKALVVSLSLATVMLLVGAAALWWAHGVRDRAFNELRQAKQALEASRNRYQQTVNEEQLIRQTINRFERLGASGIIGTERRLDWADEMRNIRTRLRLPALEFELEPRRPLSKADDSGERFTLAASQMQLHASLLHEGDLFDLMAALRTPTSALVVPRQCSLTPVTDKASPQTNLRAECTLDWLTLLPPAKSGDKP
ncbi:hypothetical protein [Viridibacterium curvum]|uniref:Uncharacterized protein n=1 Tax=Viridibacterium curvum TaxID=1101404 RepID=A0ABP9R135_9RHOO